MSHTWQVTGEKVDPDGVARGGDGGKFVAESEEAAIQAFRDCHSPDKPGVFTWRISAVKVG